MYSDPVIRRVRRLLAQGKSQRAIARALKVSRGTIAAVGAGTRRLRAEVPANCKLDGSKRIPPYRAPSKNRYRRRAAKMYRDGKTLEMIGAAANVSIEAVRIWLIQDGVPRRHSRDR
jgi:transposase